MDVYLYAFGNPDARMVLHHVGYGEVSPYLPVPGGDYSVAMRGAGASPTSPRVVQASMKHPQVTVSWGEKVIASRLPFASVTS